MRESSLAVYILIIVQIKSLIWAYIYIYERSHEPVEPPPARTAPVSNSTRRWLVYGSHQVNVDLNMEFESAVPVRKVCSMQLGPCCTLVQTLGIVPYSINYCTGRAP